MSRYTQGRTFEYRVRDYFAGLGWVVVRSAGSKTKADLIAMRDGLTLLIQCKRKAWPGPAERQSFAEMCHLAGHPGIIARECDRKLEFRGITSDGQLAGTWFAPARTEGRSLPPSKAVEARTPRKARRLASRGERGS